MDAPSPPQSISEHINDVSNRCVKIVLIDEAGVVSEIENIENSSEQITECTSDFVNNLEQTQTGVDANSVIRLLNTSNVSSESSATEPSNIQCQISLASCQCRTCGKNSNNLTGIYSAEGKEMMLEEKINSYLPIHVTKDDVYSLAMCFVCIARLENCHSIFESCIVAEQMFCSNTVSSPKNESEEVLFVMKVDSEGTSTIENCSVKLSKHTMHPSGYCTEDADDFSVERNFQDSLSSLNGEPVKKKRKYTKRQSTKSKVANKPKKASQKNCRGKKFKKNRDINEEENNEDCFHRSSRQSSNSRNVLREISCGKCGDLFETRDLYASHLRKHRIESEVLSHNCKICHKKFRTSYLLSEHKKSHSSPSLSCKLCDKTFTLSCNLKRHMLCHSSEKPHQCHLCMKSFKRSDRLASHMQCHEETKQSCPKCNKTLSCLRSYKVHMQNHDKGIIEPVKCPICLVEFKNKPSMELHVIYKHPDSPLVPNLAIKMKEKIFQCTHCEAKLTSKGALRKHINMHTKQKKYECKTCQKVFYNPNGYQQHLLIHNDDRPFACPTCPKRFARRDVLEIHTRTHTGEKPYVCDVCKRAFAQQYDMKKHKARHSTIANNKRTTKSNHAWQSAENKPKSCDVETQVQPSIQVVETHHQPVELVAIYNVEPQQVQDEADLLMSMLNSS